MDPSWVLILDGFGWSTPSTMWTLGYPTTHFTQILKHQWNAWEINADHQKSSKINVDHQTLWNYSNLEVLFFAHQACREKKQINPMDHTWPNPHLLTGSNLGEPPSGCVSKFVCVILHLGNFNREMIGKWFTNGFPKNQVSKDTHLDGAPRDTMG